MSLLGYLLNRLPEIRAPSCVKDKFKKSCSEPNFIVVEIFFLGGGGVDGEDNAFLCCLIGPLRDPVTWYKITYTGEQVAHEDFQNNAPAFVL